MVILVRLLLIEKLPHYTPLRRRLFLHPKLFLENFRSDFILIHQFFFRLDPTYRGSLLKGGFFRVMGPEVGTSAYQPLSGNDCFTVGPADHRFYLRM